MVMFTQNAIAPKAKKKKKKKKKNRPKESKARKLEIGTEENPLKPRRKE